MTKPFIYDDDKSLYIEMNNIKNVIYAMSNKKE